MLHCHIPDQARCPSYLPEFPAPAPPLADAMSPSLRTSRIRCQRTARPDWFPPAHGETTISDCRMSSSTLTSSAAEKEAAIPRHAGEEIVYGRARASDSRESVPGPVGALRVQI